MSKNNEIQFEQVLESAAKLQSLVPDAVLVGGSAAAFYAHHRLSYDHDHVVSNLNQRFEVVFEALKSDSGWKTSRTTDDVLILGELDGVQAVVRNLRRKMPLEVEEHILENGMTITVPTLEEILRIKGYFIFKRNWTRDYLDVAALSKLLGFQNSAIIFNSIDHYYSDIEKYTRSIASELLNKLANPRPKDSRATTKLKDYKNLSEEFQDWEFVKNICTNIAKEMIKNA